MKFIKIYMILCVMVACCVGAASAQNPTLVKMRGTVLDSDKKPVEGASVSSSIEAYLVVKTDALGKFTLEIQSDDVMAISFPGFKTRFVSPVRQAIEIILLPEEVREEIPLPFRTVERKELPVGVSAVNVHDLLKKNYFTYSLDGMEAFVPGFNGNSTWGMGSYLFMIDGVPRETGNITPTEIDQVVFLKGAHAAALYGSRAAKGVVNVITKRGKANERRFDLRVNNGVNFAKRYPLYLGSAEYMSLYNEARKNDGLSELYSETDIYHHAAGANPYRYPNVDFYSQDYLKNAYNRFDAAAEISGGNERARYYTNLGYTRNESFLNFGEAKKNNHSDRLNFRGNIDVSLNDYLSLYADASAIFYTGKGVNANYWASAATVRPNRFAPLIPINLVEEDDNASQVLIQNSNNLINDKYVLGGTQLDQTNPFATIYAGGNNQYANRQFQFNTGLKADLRNVMQGLSFKTGFAVDYATAYSLSYNYTYATFAPTWNNYSGTDLISRFTVYGQDSRSGTQNVSGNWYRQTIAFSGQLDYNQVFNKNHHVSAILLANGYQESESAIYHRTSNANLGLLASYNYSGKYYADFSSAYIHSAKMPPGRRQALSPSLALSWRLSEEDFLSDSKWIDELRLSASASILNTDLDITDYYMYQGYYTVAGAWYGWKDGTGIQATESRRGDNPLMAFPKRKEIAAGLEGLFFQRTLALNATFFTNRISGNIIQASVLFPSYFSTGWPVSSFIPYVNYNEDQRTGFDFGATLHRKSGEVQWSLGVNGTFYETKAIKRAEVFEDEYQYRQGKVLDGIWGLQNLGFFRDQEDIETSPSQTFGQVKPGDIKYKDQNGDGTVDTRDEVFLGKGGWFGAPFTAGIHLTAAYRNVSLFVLGTGRLGANGLRNNSYFWIDGEDKYSVVVRDRWTEATKETATYPRLTTLNSDNNFRSSDFWLYKANRFDLSRIQLSYDLSSLLKNRNRLRELGIYVSGANLLTISPDREIMELNIGAAPQTRFYNVGIKALF